AACDHFEDAFRAGQRPRIEDFLAEAAAGERPALLGELLGLEVELRRKRGERLERQDYLDRFPGEAGLVRAAFEAASTRPDAAGAPPLRETAQNLLLGLLALQNNFVSRDGLLAAFAAWVADRSRPLGRVLCDQGALDADRLAPLEWLVREHLKIHGDDPEKS